MTVTVIFRPASAFVSLYVDFDAPLIETPFRFHWYFNFTEDGDHLPAETFSVRPTFAVPETLGTGVDDNSCKATDLEALVFET
ncbi:hypothetical protein, partial [Glutamicibacter arilaitensis]|uniref:hypothetical protein n=1 Tax=Glutamicibacter arilaitensis TaxID=256701 RepID=UPI003FD13B08